MPITIDVEEEQTTTVTSVVEKKEPIKRRSTSGISPPGSPPKIAISGSTPPENDANSWQELMRRLTKDVVTRPWEADIFIDELTYQKQKIESAANVIWSLFVSTGDVLDSIKSVVPSISDEWRDSLRYCIVKYPFKGGNRYDLLILSSNYKGNPVVVPLKNKSTHAQIRETLNSIGQIHFGITTANDDRQPMRDERDELDVLTMLNSSSKRKLLKPFVKRTVPTIVFMEMPLVSSQASAPKAPLEINNANGIMKTSTAGATVVRKRDKLEGVTGAYHAMEADGVSGHVGQSVTVNGISGVVESIHQVSDSVFISVIGIASVVDQRPCIGIRQTDVPRMGSSGMFNGFRSLAASTTITVVPLTLLVNHPSIQQLFFSTPDTRDGDSGCGLFDDEGYLIGFCNGSTGKIQGPTSSMWIWAASVMNYHGLI